MNAQVAQQISALRAEAQRLQNQHAGEPMPGAPEGVPQTWWEWWSSLYSPYKYILTPAILPKVLNCPGNSSNACLDTILIPEPMYVFELCSRAERVDTGAFPDFQYLIGFSSNTENWTGGAVGSTTVAAALVTGDVSTLTCKPPRWEWPRECNSQDIVNIAIDNPNNTPALRVYVDIRGFFIRERNALLGPQRSPTR